MKKSLLISLLIGALPLGMAAQDDDLYFVPKKSTTTTVAEPELTFKRGMPRDTYYSGSDRSVDDYNRRLSTYVPIDSVMSDTIDFSAEMGVYPDSLGADDYELTKRLGRFDGYDYSQSSAYWAGYNAGRNAWGWYSPWYYNRYGWYDPWYYGGWYDPYYYYGWYDPWYAGYYGYYGWGYPYRWGWGYPYYYYDWAYYPTYYYGGGGSFSHNNHSGTIRHGDMNGRVYARNGSGVSTGGGGSRINTTGSYGGGTTRLGSSRTSSLREATVSGHANYQRSSSGRSTTVSGHSSFDRGSYSSSNNSSYSSSSSSNSGSSYSSSSSYSGGGGGGASRSGGFSGGGGSRSGGGGGGHVGGRR